ncbi:alpha/beta hydrolase [Aestuariicella hydrocarbonica]|uniref:Alpha/beta hydrolase n=1 Tax=Pseudomaricurvus hydrocarbonicus TaxID=1470433 RepID=A0A9E5MJQ0_9GAMM|nr:alpha/beta hydrolase [Aestuariicella hydrocarbonica]NHO65469.1 alpha/beta hydrolase [Aestuariicella hydrocarbonica]
MHRIEDSYLNVNGLRYHLVSCGSGPLVLLTHGFPESWYSWRHQLPALAKAGFKAVALDMPGYGDTDKPDAVERYSQVALSDDIADIATQLDYETFVCVGHDWGAPTAWHTTLRFPERVRAVAAMSVPYGGRSARPPTEGFKRLFADKFYYILYFQLPGVAEAELESDIPRFLRSFWWPVSAEGNGTFAREDQPHDAQLFQAMPDPGQLPEFMTETEANHYIQAFTQHGLRGPLNYYRNIDRNWALSNNYGNNTITQPALFLYGDRDPVPMVGGELERMKHIVPGVEIQKLEKCGHWIQQEKPEEVNSRLIHFLKQL